MGDSSAAAGVPLEELQACAPWRDFNRPGAEQFEPVEHAFTLRLEGSRLADLVGAGREAFLTACVQVLLARHSRRTQLLVLVQTGSAGGRPTRVAVVRGDLSAERDFAALVGDLALQITGDVSAGVATMAYRRSVVVAFDDPSEAARRPAPVHQADLTIRFSGAGADVHATLVGNAWLYRDQSIAVLTRQLQHVVAGVAADPGITIARIPLHGEQEAQHLLRGFNQNRASFPVDRTLIDLFEAQAAADPAAVCVVHGERSVSFAELNAIANRLARHLVMHGAGPGRFIAVLDQRGIHFVVAVLAIWKAGAAYLPIDPGYPEERVRHMLVDSEVELAVVGRTALARHAHLAPRCPLLRQMICLDDPDAPATTANGWDSDRIDGPEALQPQADHDLGRIASAGDPAYMIYTSGSTGLPKGAVVRHDGAVNHLFAQARSLGRDTIARFLQSAPSSSDISVWQFAAPLVFGGVAVIVDDATDVEHLVAQVQRHRLGIIELVPVVLKHLIGFLGSLSPAERALPDLRWAMVTGESVPVALVNAWLQLYPDIPVVNAYGPTEASDDVAQAILRTPLPERLATVPIGRPLANLDIYVLDEHLQPVPIGVPGEICIAGVGVGNGYWKREQQTRASFVPNPFPGAAGPVIYRSGDVGRWHDDGTLECFGRQDHQVQLRGVRIELQEVESVLREHPGVSEAVVKAFHDGSGDGRLVAFYVATTAGPPQPQALRDFMAARLAPAMLPGTVVRVASLPLNPAGKVDRQALVAPPVYAPQARATTGAPPANPTEAALARVWQDELSVEQVGRHDNFFDLGGDSLAALAVVVAARAHGLYLRPSDLFQHPTVAGLAGVARALPAAAAGSATHPGTLHPVSALSAAERGQLLAAQPQFEDVLALSPTQQGIYLHGLLSRDKSVYVDQYTYTLTGRLALPEFQRSWNLVVARHATLRTAFLRSALSQPVQAVHRALEVPIEVVDASAADEPGRDRLWDELLQTELQRGFVLARPPLLRLVLFRLAPQCHRLVWTHHHIVLDGWSMSLVLREVGQLYCGLLCGVMPELAPPVPYASHVDALAAYDIAPAERFWRDCLAGYRGATALGIAPPGSTPPGYGQVGFDLDADATDRLNASARRAGVTPTTLLQAAWACVLSQATGVTDTVFGVVTSGRQIDLPGMQQAVGLFVTTLPLRLDTTRHGSTNHWMAQVQAQGAAMREHEALPLSQVVRWADLPPGQPLFETLFVMANYPAPDIDDSGPLHVEPAGFRTVPAYPLSVIITPGVRLAVRLTHDRQRFDFRAADGLAKRYLAAISVLAAGLDPRPHAGHAGPLDA